MRFLFVCLLSALLLCTLHSLVAADSGVPVHYAPAVLSAADTEAAAQGMALIEVRSQTQTQASPFAAQRSAAPACATRAKESRRSHWGTARD